MVGAMILAAGLGTRLRPLSLELPKPLFWVGDEWAVGHIARRLSDAGFDRAVINTHYLASAFESEGLARLPLELKVLFEPEILGTSGGVANAIEFLGQGDIVIWNGDILADLDIKKLMAAHEEDEGRVATLVAAPREKGMGTLGLGRNGDVVRLRGEVFGDEVAGGDFLGVQVLGRALRGRLVKPGCLVGDVYLPALREKMRIGSFGWEGGWWDIGTPRSYWEANLQWLKKNRRDGRYLGPGVDIPGGVWVEDSVIGEKASIEGEGAIRECVVWPGARVVAPLERAIVSTGGAVLRL